ncbi:HET-domain-containing protein [Thozetella sp. PMI_491]|nr:HET-domain-containing protein [Thozetella sp. PMI_491]
MPTVSEFPRLKLYELRSDVDQNSIQYHMWYEKDGYGYTRTRQDLEHAVVLGCAFCSAVAAHDRKYECKGDFQDKVKLSFDKPRPTWYPPLDEELKLRIRYQWIDNCLWIWSEAGVEWQNGDVSWGMYTTEDDPAASIVHSRAVLTELGSEQSFAEARAWMDACFTNHDGCPPKKPADLPKRLVQVSRLDGNKLFARLCETNGETGYYCALSYCWGGDQKCKTDTTRYSQYQQELPYADLPQTIKDAFQVTLGMGLQYVWIDSLCIIQDSDEDKQIEMSKMMHIYQNTQFTISAASSSAVTSGFLKANLHDPQAEAFYHPLRVDKETMGAVIIATGSSSFATVGAHQQPINNRGWTLQETILTPRILIFAGIHMIWKCQSGYQPHFQSCLRSAREEPNESPWEFWSNLSGYTFTSLAGHDGVQEPKYPRTGEGFNFLLTDFYNQWHSILREYTTRRLSVESDRLPAISAIAQAFAPHLQSDYFAGLWGKFLIHDLMWENSLSGSRSVPTKPGPPSWSWVKLQGEHSYDNSNEDFALADVISCKTWLVSEKNPFGEVTGDEIVLRGPIKKTWLDAESKILLAADGESMPDIKYISDGGNEDQGDDRLTVWCLLLGDSSGGVMHREWPNCVQSGTCRRSCTSYRKSRMIVMITSPSQGDCFERIGLAKAEDYGKPPWWNRWNVETIICFSRSDHSVAEHGPFGLGFSALCALGTPVGRYFDQKAIHIAVPGSEINHYQM